MKAGPWIPKSKALLCTAANVGIQQIQPHDTAYNNGRNMLCVVFLNATCMVIIYENAFLRVQSHITYVTRSFLRLEDKRLEDFTASCSLLSFKCVQDV